ncbi:MAG: hypothetical protein JO023_09160 [Chloroflexi bacterium]|nr:hypothetical protein [Chloroflexota bacterium]
MKPIAASPAPDAGDATVAPASAGAGRAGARIEPPAAAGTTPGAVAAPQRWELVAVGCILLGAAVVRLARLDLAEIGYDEASAASLVDAWKLHGLFPLAGIVSSVGIPNPPAWPYLYALALLPTDGPDAVLVLGAVFGLLAVGLCWWVGRRWLGPWGGLGAAIAYAGGFWPLVLGRTGWQPVFIQAPLLLYFDALLTLAVRRRPWALVVAAAWLGLMVQLHYVSSYFLVLLPLAWWPARHVVGPRQLGAAVVAALLPLLPFLIYELHPQVQLGDLRFLARSSGSTPEVDLGGLSLWWNMAGNGGAAGLAGPSYAGLQAELGRWVSLAQLGPLMAALGLLAAVLIAPRGWTGVLLVGFTLVIPIVLIRHTLAIYFHYLYLELPFIALAIGALVAVVARTRWRLAWAGMALALACYVAACLATLAALLDYVQRVDTRESGYGVPLTFNLAAGQAARALVPPGGSVLVGGPNFKVAILRFTLGYDIPTATFEDCREVPYEPNTIYLLASEHTPGAAALAEAGAPLLARVERPGDAFLVYGDWPSRTSMTGLEARPEHDSDACRARATG